MIDGSSWPGDSRRARIAELVLQDPDDRHGLVAALHCKAHVIVTTNLRHCPKAVLSSHGISAQHPDDFVCDMIVADRDRAVLAFAADRARMVNPPHSVAEYVNGAESDATRTLIPIHCGQRSDDRGQLVMTG